ncbi:hypothetical protein MPH_02780 [Macrophomina phaseolina MS6]|uniref:Uncharacterized protein n=1 Tax=Macrophomina phaseolina (strain MS6) TaxID=1126212 RepID=K2S4M3_MACPH|nr:hypothetical protein MPH_02780 [Macrophomina phaseolina MS6]
MSDTTSILTIGLDFDWTEANRGDKFDVSKIRAAVSRGLEELKSVPGVESDVYFVVPDKQGLFDEIAAKLRDGHGGKPWSGVIVGWGVRGVDETTPLFEALMNLIKDTSPSSKFLFTGPGGVQFEAIERNFPHLKRPA